MHLLLAGGFVAQYGRGDGFVKILSRNGCVAGSHVGGVVGVAFAACAIGTLALYSAPTWHTIFPATSCHEIFHLSFTFVECLEYAFVHL